MGGIHFNDRHRRYRFRHKVRDGLVVTIISLLSIRGGNKKGIATTSTLLLPPSNQTHHKMLLVQINHLQVRRASFAEFPPVTGTATAASHVASQCLESINPEHHLSSHCTCNRKH